MELKNEVYLLSAPWCTQCKMVKPKAQEKIEGLNEINIDDNPEVPSELEIMSIPTFVDNRNGEKVVYSGAGECLNFLNNF